MDSEAERRFRTIRNHLTSTAAAAVEQEQASLLCRRNAAGEFFFEQGFSNALPEELKTGKWNVYRRSVEAFPDCNYLGSRVQEDGTVGEYVSHWKPVIELMIYLHGILIQCNIHYRYKWMTYKEADTARSAIGSALGSCVGLYFINRPEWLIVDHACSAYSFISVPLYDTLGPEAVKYIANHAAIEAIFCVPETLNHLLSFVSEIPSLHLIVVVGAVDGRIPSLPPSSGVEIISYSTLLSQGLSNLQPFCPPKPETVATICYTSGTTGTPKGAVLTHGNLIANVAGMSIGINLYSSDIIMNVVKTSGSLREKIFNAAYNAKKQAIFNGELKMRLQQLFVLSFTLVGYGEFGLLVWTCQSLYQVHRPHLVSLEINLAAVTKVIGKNPSPFWDRLVFNKIKSRLGGRIRYMVSGASPLSPDVMDFLRVCFGCQVIEGYGMTETSCTISNMDQSDILSGHVGSPNPACEIKLVDVPEMNYTYEDQPYPHGEICVRGPIVFQGYYKDEVQTQEMIDKDGWLHTGDIGVWLPGGRLKIIDRKKNIFKLAQGEYVAPEKIENVYAKSKYVAHCFIHGDSLSSSLVAIVCVDPDMFKAWAINEGIKNKDVKQLCTDPRAKAAILKDMDTVGKEAQLRGFEFAKAITLVLEPFTLENNLLTPTYKIKRPQARTYFAKEIADMYAQLSTSNSSPDKIL
ncbi:hypothetical protein MTR67_041084 [Solanum verrucosum]|uniref:AMP-dependent synthetase/ligase domain-containing protein n=1 Tax=Solanum verrucosum TaxID=315347 RepID=A0AAF0UM05_SOLVR|nr:hypothetical protein MTR67_041084 [Solanum verrucosum]